MLSGFWVLVQHLFGYGRQEVFVLSIRHGPAPLVMQLVQYLRSALRAQVAVQPVQGNPNDIVVMELGAQPPLAQVKPEVMQQLQVFGPEPRRMRTKVEVERLLRIGEGP